MAEIELKTIQSRIHEEDVAGDVDLSGWILPVLRLPADDRGAFDRSAIYAALMTGLQQLPEPMRLAGCMWPACSCAEGVGFFDDVECRME